MEARLLHFYKPLEGVWALLVPVESAIPLSAKQASTSRDSVLDSLLPIDYWMFLAMTMEKNSSCEGW